MVALYIMRPDTLLCLLILRDLLNFFNDSFKSYIYSVFLFITFL